MVITCPRCFGGGKDFGLDLLECHGGRWGLSVVLVIALAGIAEASFLHLDQALSIPVGLGSACDARGCVVGPIWIHVRGVHGVGVSNASVHGVVVWWRPKGVEVIAAPDLPRWR